MTKSEEYITIVHGYSYPEYCHEAVKRNAIPLDADLFTQYRADLIRAIDQEQQATAARQRLETKLHLI